MATKDYENSRTQKSFSAKDYEKKMTKLNVGSEYPSAKDASELLPSEHKLQSSDDGKDEDFFSLVTPTFEKTSSSTSAKNNPADYQKLVTAMEAMKKSLAHLEQLDKLTAHMHNFSTLLKDNVIKRVDTMAEEQKNLKSLVLTQLNEIKALIPKPSEKGDSNISELRKEFTSFRNSIGDIVRMSVELYCESVKTASPVTELVKPPSESKAPKISMVTPQTFEQKQNEPPMKPIPEIQEETKPHKPIASPKHNEDDKQWEEYLESYKKDKIPVEEKIDKASGLPCIVIGNRKSFCNLKKDPCKNCRAYLKNKDKQQRSVGKCEQHPSQKEKSSKKKERPAKRAREDEKHTEVDIDLSSTEDDQPQTVAKRPKKVSSSQPQTPIMKEPESEQSMITEPKTPKSQPAEPKEMNVVSDTVYSDKIKRFSPALKVYNATDPKTNTPIHLISLSHALSTGTSVPFLQELIEKLNTKTKNQLQLIIGLSGTGPDVRRYALVDPKNLTDSLLDKILPMIEEKRSTGKSYTAAEFIDAFKSLIVAIKNADI